MTKRITNENRPFLIYLPLPLGKRKVRNISLSVQEQEAAVYVITRSTIDIEHEQSETNIVNYVHAGLAVYLLGIDPERKALAAQRDVLKKRIEGGTEGRWSIDNLLQLASAYRLLFGEGLNHLSAPIISYAITKARPSTTDYLIGSSRDVAALQVLFPNAGFAQIARLPGNPTREQVWQSMVDTSKIKQQQTAFADRIDEYVQQLAFMRLLDQERFDKEVVISDSMWGKILNKLAVYRESPDPKRLVALSLHLAMLQATQLRVLSSGEISIVEQEEPDQPEMPRLRRTS